MSKLKNKKSGFTLIELMIVVAILGILAAIAIPAFATYVRRSKTSEVYGNIEGLFKATSAYYNKEFQSQGITGVQRGHCGIGASSSIIGGLGAPVPPAAGSGDVKLLSPDPNTIPGSSYGETGIGFNAGSSYYVYGNSGFATACDGSSAVAAYTLVAYGNLDADADTSAFELATATNTSNEIYKAGAVFITSELE